jgi:hypothetical protein
VLSISEIPELIKDYENGGADWSIVYSVRFRMLSDNDVEVVNGALSPELEAQFRTSLGDETWNDGKVG